MLFGLLLSELLEFCGDRGLFWCAFSPKAEKALLGVLVVAECVVLVVSVKVFAPSGAVGCWLSSEAILEVVS
jgi:hypothetical protein